MRFSRREILQMSAFLPFGIIINPLYGEQEIRFPSGNVKDFWKDNYIVHKNVDISRLDKNIINAKVDGAWKEFPIRGYSDEFLDWNLKNRQKLLGIFLRMFEGDKNASREISFDGAHNAMVASYGRAREDSIFSLNNAVKGTGLVPEQKLLKERIEEFRQYDSADDKDMQKRKKKIELLLQNYKKPELWDRRALISLELYTTPSFQTHTFLNVMENPVTNVVFLDVVSYELRCICYLIDPLNPDLSDIEKQWIEYSNGAHSHFHGKFKRNFITALYFVIEEFDNSPGRPEKGHGKRTVP
ncbi:MAG: hypothetical protein JXA60_04505 [Candidatus Coatesbacteria bacterium]|nr:hypothetical protein [Candidatus Coatesbacteria bacterium]